MEEINLYDLMRFYARKWMTILIAIMIGAIAGIAYTFYIQQPQYKSTATLLLVNTGRTVSNQESVVINNYVELFTSRRVLGPVVEAQRYEQGYQSLSSQTTAVNVKDTDIINVSIATTDAKKSKALLESAINKFKDESKQLYGDSTVKISVVDAANEPTDSINKKPLQQIGLAVVGSTVIAIIGLFFVYDFRAQIKPNTKSGDKNKPNDKMDAAKKSLGSSIAPAKTTKKSSGKNKKISR